MHGNLLHCEEDEKQKTLQASVSIHDMYKIH